MSFNPYSGLSLSDLQAEFTAVQTAWRSLSRGAQVATVSYAQGDGSKSVTYQLTSAEKALAQMMSVQSAINALQGQSSQVRRPMRPFF